MKVYEVWIGQWEDSEAVFKHTSKALAEMFLEKALLVHPEARLQESEVADFKEFDTQYVWLEFSTFIDHFEMAKEQKVEYKKLKHDWSPFTLKCREYHLEESYFDTELGDIYYLKDKEIHFESSNIIVWCNENGVGDFGVLVRYKFDDLISFRKNHSDFKRELEEWFSVWFEEWAEKMSLENKECSKNTIYEIVGQTIPLNYCN